MQVPPRRVHERLRHIFDSVADERDFAVRFIADSRPANQIVGDHEPLVRKYRPEQAVHATVRIVNGVVQDTAVPGIGCHNPGLGRPGDEIVSRHATTAMKLDPVGAMWITQLQSHVTIDDHVPLDDAALRIKPQEDRPPPLAGTALNPHEDIVTDDPVFGIHHIDTRDVVALGNIRLVIRESLRSIVVEQAILNPALFRTSRLAIQRGHLDAFDPALPDVVNDTVVDGQPLNVRLRIDLETVPLDVLDGQIGHGHAGACPEAEQLAMLAPRTVDDHPLPASRSAAQRHVVRSNFDIVGHPVQTVGEQDGLAALRVCERLDEPIRIGDFNDRALPVRQSRRLRKPRLHRGLQCRGLRLGHRGRQRRRQNDHHEIRCHFHPPDTVAVRAIASYRTPRDPSTPRPNRIRLRNWLCLALLRRTGAGPDSR